MEGTKNFSKFLEDISKGVRFHKAAGLQPICLVKRKLLLKKILMFMLKFNNPYTVYNNNPRGVFGTQSHIYDGAFLLHALSQLLDWVLKSELWKTSPGIGMHDKFAIFNNLTLLFNRDLNRGCLVYMFSLRFSGSKFLMNLRRQFRVRKIFSCT